MTENSSTTKDTKVHEGSPAEESLT